MTDKKIKYKLVKTGPCPYQPIGNGLAVVDIEQMLKGYGELKSSLTPQSDIEGLKEEFSKFYIWQPVNRYGWVVDAPVVWEWIEDKILPHITPTKEDIRREAVKEFVEKWNKWTGNTPYRIHEEDIEAMEDYLHSTETKGGEDE